MLLGQPSSACTRTLHGRESAHVTRRRRAPAGRPRAGVRVDGSSALAGSPLPSGGQAAPGRDPLVARPRRPVSPGRAPTEPASRALSAAARAAAERESPRLRRRFRQTPVSRIPARPKSRRGTAAAEVCLADSRPARVRHTHTNATQARRPRRSLPRAGPGRAEPRGGWRRRRRPPSPLRPRPPAPTSRSELRNYLVDPASSICLSQRLSHASLSTHGRYSETANGSLNQLWFL